MGLILHDNVRPHLGKVVTDLLSKYEWEVLPHAPYSPDMSPPDFDLFHKLKEPMRGHSFPSLEEVSAAVTRAIRGLKNSGTLNGIAIFRNVGTRSLSRETTQKDCNEILPTIKYTFK
jgi:transposase